MKDGAIQQSNFNDYHVLRMSDMPELHIRIIATNNPPTGMGEVGIPTVAPAIGNAVATLTGKRLRHLPMSLRPGEEGAGLRPAFDRPHSRRVPPGTRRACFWAKPFCTPMASGGLREYLCRDTRSFPMDDKTRTELEAAVYRRLVEHLRTRTDVQNIDMMNLAGFCRNCLSNWMKDAADAKGVPMTKDQSREIVYGEPFDQWKAKHQKEASPEQKAAFEKSSAAHKH